ncbi:MAG: Phytanoyl-CoA dioxygenase [Chloroflexi bacterium]|jgi:ectoine hydroxylase-related dioxygenase (phytanoyl-CoA dioxygenase family)|nr:Phytanoyl-CoA dioxygenase [Chloroflexota bacterium]
MTMRLLQGPLSSNGFTLEDSPDRLGWLVPSDPTGSIEVLWEQYKSQGYLWLKGLLDREAVLAFRRFYFTAFQSTGLLKPGTDPVEGIYSNGEVDQIAAHKIAVEAVRWPEFEQFCLSEPIVKFYEAFFGGDIYLHKRKIIRHTKPADPNCTGGHYDLIYLRAGTDRLCSSWIPLGDTPVEMGGLIYLEGSDALGRKLEAEFSAKNGNLSPEERISAYNQNMKTGWISEDLPSLAHMVNGRWLMADYEAGDMVIHSPYTIHASTVNHDPRNRLRLSTDIRFQRLDDKIDPRWINDWSPDDKL